VTGPVRDVWTAIGGAPDLLDRLASAGVHESARTGALPSSFDVEGLALGAFGALGLAVAEWSRADGPVVVDPAGVANAVRSELAVRPGDAPLTEAPNPLSGVFAAADGWVRLHGDSARHRGVIMRVLGTDDPAGVAAALAAQPAEAVEAALHRGGGAAAAARSLDAWGRHPHGRTVTELPLVTTTRRADRAEGVRGGADRERGRQPQPAMPRLRVLELSGGYAAPIAGRALAWFGADVLRIAQPGGAEPDAFRVDGDAGKRVVTLDLRTTAGRLVFLDLLADADVFLNGLRPGVLERLGLGADARAAVRPGVIDASVSAYGATGGWAGHRGSDRLLQFSCGLAVAEAAAAGAPVERGGLPAPRALPCDILDHATGVLLAAGTLRALAARRGDGAGRTVSASLARTAAFLASTGGRLLDPEATVAAPPPGSYVLAGSAGPTAHVPVPVSVGELPAGWRSAPPLAGSDAPAWPLA
jgi:hypothetical protein